MNVCASTFPIDPVTPGGACVPGFFDPDTDASWT